LGDTQFWLRRGEKIGNEFSGGGLSANTGFSMSQSSGGGLTPLFVCARDVKFKLVSNAVKQISVPTDIFCNVFIFGFLF